jgi:hypothetical protein
MGYARPPAFVFDGVIDASRTSVALRLKGIAPHAAERSRGMA